MTDEIKNDDIDPADEDGERIAYVRHPISRAEKKAILKNGYDRILDARFNPEGNKPNVVLERQKKEAADAKKSAGKSDGKKPAAKKED